MYIFCAFFCQKAKRKEKKKKTCKYVKINVKMWVQLPNPFELHTSGHN